MEQIHYFWRAEDSSPRKSKEFKYQLVWVELINSVYLSSPFHLVIAGVVEAMIFPWEIT